MSCIHRYPEEASRGHYDLIIVGGGIYGAMLSWEASRCGLRSLLVEQNDFGSATSFNSLRIIHGGLRYLQSLNLYRLREFMQECQWFLHAFPRLVKPLPCLMPLYGTGLRRLLVVRGALSLYGMLSPRPQKDVDTDLGLPPGRVINAHQTQELFTGVDTAGLVGGAVWYEGGVPDSPRLLIEVLRRSSTLGATALNYVKATQLLGDHNHVEGILATDRETGHVHEYRANVVLNATGPWSRITAACFDQDREALFRSSIAWNVLLNRDALSDHILAVTPKKPAAQTYLLYPWKGKILAGTGHAPWNGAPDDPRPSALLLANFIEDLNQTVPGLRLSDGDITRVFSGLLPAKDRAATKLSVREVIIDHGRIGGPRGLYSISGVRFTMSRRVAKKALGRIFSRAFSARSMNPTAGDMYAPLQEGWDLQAADTVKPEAWSACEKTLRKVINQESVVHLDDLVFRRTTLWEDPNGALCAAPQLCSLFPWNGVRRAAEIQRLRRSLECQPGIG